jgi:hypothetical protein
MASPVGAEALGDLGALFCSRANERRRRNPVCARMRLAIAAGLESAPIGVITKPGTKTSSSALAATLFAGPNGPLVQF